MLDEKGFDSWASSYDETTLRSDEENTYPFAGYREALDTLYRTVMEKENAAVLDIGFGTGILTAKLYENGCRIYGQDFSQQMIETAQKKMPRAVLVRGDFSQGLAKPLNQLTYDFIIAAYSLHHLSDPQKVCFLEELYEHLNDGGMILIADVAFETRSQLEQCAIEAGDSWDEDEIYFVYDEMKEFFPALSFQKISFCAGILSLQKDH